MARNRWRPLVLAAVLVGCGGPGQSGDKGRNGASTPSEIEVAEGLNETDDDRPEPMPAFGECPSPDAVGLDPGITVSSIGPFTQKAVNGETFENMGCDYVDPVSKDLLMQITINGEALSDEQIGYDDLSAADRLGAEQRIRDDLGPWRVIETRVDTVAGCSILGPWFDINHSKWTCDQVAGAYAMLLGVEPPMASDSKEDASDQTDQTAAESDLGSAALDSVVQTVDAALDAVLAALNPLAGEWTCRYLQVADTGDTEMDYQIAASVSFDDATSGVALVQVTGSRLVDGVDEPVEGNVEFPFEITSNGLEVGESEDGYRYLYTGIAADVTEVLITQREATRSIALTAADTGYSFSWQGFNGETNELKCQR